MTAAFVYRFFARHKDGPRGVFAFVVALTACVYAIRVHGQDAVNVVDVTSATKIQFKHSDGASGRRYIVETVVAGIAVFDYDGDGWLDIYFLNGAALPGTTTQRQLRNALYRNNRDWTFTDVTISAGLSSLEYGMGVAAADFDEDGDEDLYLTNFGHNILYLNNGDGTFADITQVSGIDCSFGFGSGAVWFDMDRDGDLDLYSGNYVDFNFESKHVPRLIGSYEFHPGPAAYAPSEQELYRNNGDGSFDDVSQSSGIGLLPGPGMGAIAFDADEDNDIDLFICNDGKPNFLFLNDGHGQFVEGAIVAGVAVDRGGKANGNMGVDVGDADGDGLLDLLTTDYQDELPVLYQNIGGGLFQDVSTRARIDPALIPHVKWGVGFVDIDNDADRDIFIACGHFLDNIRFVDDRTNIKVANFLLINNGRGKFTDVSSHSGSGMQVVESSRGAAFDDLDNDGDTDIAILNTNGPPTIIRNDSLPKRNWLDIRLIGRQSNRSASGALVKLTCNDKSQVQMIHNGRGYQSHFGTRLHFGLGDVNDVDQLEIVWPSGLVQKVVVDNINQVLDVIEPKLK